MKEQPKKFDFSGYVTRNDVRCSDGLTIRQDAFSHDDGRVVPLVWQHGSGDPGNILGVVQLENRPDGVYGYATFNESTNANNVKNLIKHGAIQALSIYANKLSKLGNDVLSGVIREVSTVLSGANPGAFIDSMDFAHGDDADFNEAVFYYPGESLTLSHSEEEPELGAKPELEVKPEAEVEAEVKAEVETEVEAEVEAEADVEHADTSGEETVGDILATLSGEQKAAVAFMLEEMDAKANGLTMSDSSTQAKPGEKTVADVLATLTDKQKSGVGYLIDELDKGNTDTNSANDTSATHSEGETNMGNVFEDQNGTENTAPAALTHQDFVEIMEAGKKLGSFKDAFIQHMEDAGYELQHADGDYGITNVGMLFPDARAVNPTPDFITRAMAWVGVVMSQTKHSPFSRIKSLAADITPDEARAKGYIKGTQKVNEVFELLTRSTTPTTIYKKQKMDRDDILDITDFDVIVWLRTEMRLMLDEEAARAILIGDGRTALNPDKIKEDRIRPIYTDVDLYAVHVEIKETTPDKQIDEVVRAMKLYKGSGTPTLFAGPDVITDLLLVKDTLGRRLYPTLTELAAALRVDKIVEVEPMSGVVNATDMPLFGIIVNLADYTVGSDKGGEVNAFDDFDINFNQQHYLIETRISGALMKPMSALVLEMTAPLVG